MKKRLRVKNRSRYSEESGWDQTELLLYRFMHVAIIISYTGISAS